MTSAEIVKKLQALGTVSYKKILLNHGVNEPVFGVKIEELKKIQNRIKKDYQLAPGATANLLAVPNVRWPCGRNPD